MGDWGRGGGPPRRGYEVTRLPPPRAPAGPAPVGRGSAHDMRRLPPPPPAMIPQRQGGRSRSPRRPSQAPGGSQPSRVPPLGEDGEVLENEAAPAAADDDDDDTEGERWIKEMLLREVKLENTLQGSTGFIRTKDEEEGDEGQDAIDNLLHTAAASAAAIGRRLPPPPPDPTKQRQFARPSSATVRSPPQGSPADGGRSLSINGVPIDPDTTCVADVRFDRVEDAASVVLDLHGGTFEAGRFGPTTIAVVPHESSRDETKVVVHGLPLGIEWQELKDFFKQHGQVAFAALRASNLRRSDAPPPVPGTLVGEVRYDQKDHAHEAVEKLDGSKLGGQTISVILDGSSKDGTKLIVTGIPYGIEWQELKDHFSTIGTVGFAGIKGDSGKGSSRGKGPPPRGDIPRPPMMSLMSPYGGAVPGWKGYKGWDKGGGYDDFGYGYDRGFDRGYGRIYGGGGYYQQVAKGKGGWW